MTASAKKIYKSTIIVRCVCIQVHMFAHITSIHIYTLPETNSSPLKMGHPKSKFIFQPLIFRGELLVSGSVIIYTHIVQKQMTCNLSSPNHKLQIPSEPNKERIHEVNLLKPSQNQLEVEKTHFPTLPDTKNLRQMGFNVSHSCKRRTRYPR